MSIFSLFTSRKPDVSKYAFVDTEVGTKDLLMDEIGRWNQLSRNQKKIYLFFQQKNEKTFTLAYFLLTNDK